MFDLPPEETKKERIGILDALRGLCILLVIAYHLGFNLVGREILPEGVLYNPLLNILQPFFAGVFIALAGISSRFSKDNFRRGRGLAGCALLVTAVSLFVRAPILFGILHLLAACVLLYTLLESLRVTVPAVLLAAFLLPRFGITQWPAVVSYDYFPLVPWGFVFFFGVWLGGPIKDRKLPERFYTMKIPVLPAIGRKTLLIYLLHQPVLYILLWILGAE